jgi:hypothetical protein
MILNAQNLYERIDDRVNCGVSREVVADLYEASSAP